MNLVIYFFVAFIVCLKLELANCFNFSPIRLQQYFQRQPQLPINGILEPKDLKKLLKDPQFDKNYRLLEVNSGKDKTGFDK